MYANLKKKKLKAVTLCRFLLPLRKIHLVMKVVKNIFNTIRGNKYTKYIITIFVIILVVGFIDDNSVMNSQERKRKIEKLKSEIADLKAKYEEDTQKLNSLKQHDQVERLARERYFMKRTNEDVFIIKTDK
ncbi:MAG: septum formation initiator family protein [Bacteroidaceae bacterium]|nr:septum formation initiator family protein [Bacteroidaceae bacterium]